MVAKKEEQFAFIQGNKKLFWVLIFGLGGVCLKKQFEDLAYRGESTKLLKVGLLRKQKLGRNVVYLATKPVFEFWGLKHASARYSIRKLLKSSLLAKRYEDVYRNDLNQMIRGILKSNAMFYTPIAHVDFLEDTIKLFQKHHLDVTALQWETDRLLQRAEDTAARRVGVSKKTRVHKTIQEDLFTLAAKNIYVSDARYDTSESIFHIDAIILDVDNLRNQELANRIALVCESLENIFSSVKVVVTIEVHSHRKIPKAMRENIMQRVKKTSAYRPKSEWHTSTTIWLIGHNSSRKLFSGISVENLM